MRITRVLLTAIAVFALSAVPALAHVTVASDNLTAGGYAVLTVKVPHGCDAKPTNKVILQVPEGVTSIQPARTPFWKHNVEMKKLDKPIKGGHGEEITEVPGTVTWEAVTPLPSHDLDMLHASIKLPDAEGIVYFPVVQECPGGDESPWNQIPSGESDEELSNPAPSLTLVKGSGDDGHGSNDEAHDDKSNDSHTDLEDDVATARTFGISGIVIGALGLIIGLVAMRRRK